MSRLGYIWDSLLKLTNRNKADTHLLYVTVCDYIFSQHILFSIPHTGDFSMPVSTFPHPT